MDYSSQALSIFVAIQGINIGGLIADYVLMKNKLPSISEVCVDHPFIGIVLVSIEVISPISLGLHLYFFNRSRV
jgi:hypothetical protein